MYNYSKPIQGLSSVRSASFLELVSDYEAALVASGYNPHVVRFHLHSVAHFGIWLELKGAQLGAIDEGTVAAFERHRSRCRCPAASRNRRRGVVSCIRVFLHHLRERGNVPDVEPAAESRALVGEFLQWLTAHRGSVETTRISYRFYVTNLIEFLGDDPQTYTAAGLRDFIAKRYGHYRRNSMRMVLAAVRMFLRYLAVEGRCRAGLEQALLSPATWAQQSLPQGLSSEEVARILTLCPSTPAGARDRAVLLLLIRLGLRAGDIANLQLGDLCFETATIKVSGKGNREVRLPLPQDVGDALLEYLRVGRPQVNSNYVFLRAVAPFGPFGTRQPGNAVKYIAGAALRRAGVQRPRRGAHVFRHTAACAMLRADVGLERIAEVLRHRSIETTGIYAKVDFHLLKQVAQPWPEEGLC
jgi:site-specific recombinase XerD